MTEFKTTSMRLANEMPTAPAPVVRTWEERLKLAKDEYEYYNLHQQEYNDPYQARLLIMKLQTSMEELEQQLQETRRLACRALSEGNLSGGKSAADWAEMYGWDNLYRQDRK